MAYHDDLDCSARFAGSVITASQRRFGDVPMLPISFGTLLKRIVQAVLAVQGVTLAALFIVDHRRKKLRKPATFPRLPPRSVTVGGSEVTVYTYGEDLYRDMLNAISQAKSRIFFESFIWKLDVFFFQAEDGIRDLSS